jgi:hypothetical protein
LSTIWQSDQFKVKLYDFSIKDSAYLLRHGWRSIGPA